MLSTFQRARAQGFTLVELLIVVVVLGILAGIVLPSINTSTEDAKVSATVQNLQTVRAALDYFKLGHNDKYPGYPASGSGAPTEALTIDQLTLQTTKDGATGAIGDTAFPLGPYLKNGFPANPFNNLKTITVIANGGAFPTAADDSTGWIYKPETGQFKANTTAKTADDQNVFDY